jgi:protein-tyrosine phosphatase
MTIIDIHCHILPGMDDGPDSIEESIDMAEAFAASGVEHVFVTPHHLPGTACSASREEIQKQLSALQKKIQQKKINLTLHPGMEAALHRHLLKELDSEQLLPLGQTDCYLLEPPFQGFRNDLIDILLSFKDTGRDIILAHPERIPFFQKKNRCTDRPGQRRYYASNQHRQPAWKIR